MSLTRKVALNTIIQSVGRIVGIFISVATIGVLTRYLGVDDYGKYNLIFVYISFFVTIADLGIFTTTVREISKREEEASKIVNSVFIFRIFFSLFIMLFAVGLSFVFYPGLDRLVVRRGIMIASLMILTNLGISGFTTVFQSKLRMDFAVLGELSTRVSVFLLVYLSSILGASFDAIIFVSVAGGFTNFLLSGFLVRKFIELKLSFDKKIAWDIFIKSIPLGIASVIGIIHFKIDTIILSLLKPDHDVGIYGLSYKVLESILAFGSFFVASIFPILSKYVHKNQEKLPNVVQKSFDALIIVGVPIIFGGLAMATGIVKAIGGNEFSASALPLQILTIAALFSFINMLFANMVIAKDEQRKILWIALATVSANIILNMFLIPRYSYIGAASVTVISESLGMILTGYIALKIYKLALSYRTLFKSVIASAVMYLFLISFGYLNIMLLFLAGVGVYFATLYLVRGINKQLILEVLRGEDE